ncbi:hypothetical protein ABW21_db0204712 [Orbilia brochopaga]|nr:hypothetical protein ABW21_db0204712 [Drechslerella brochopaga]
MSEGKLTAEEKRMIREQLEALGDHRVTNLPLGNKGPGGRRGPPPQIRQQGRFEGPGDARFNLGPRPGGPAQAQAQPARERARPVDTRWAGLYDDSLIIDRGDGLGAGDLHRQGENFRPRLQRRRSFSDVGMEQKFQHQRLNERPQNNNANFSGGPSRFRGGLQGHPNFVGGGRFGRENRPGEKPQPGFVGNHPMPRLPRGSPRDRQWSSNLLSSNQQSLFFTEMGKKTGLRVPTTPSSNVQQQVARPMPSAKDLKPEDKSAQVEAAKKAAADAPKPKISSGFIPPHLRHAVKKPVEQIDEAKPLVELVEQVGEVKSLVEPVEPVSEPLPPATTGVPAITALPPMSIDAPIPIPIKALDDPGVPRALNRRRSKDDLETPRVPSPKISDVSSAPGWNAMFWQRVVKPLWGNLLQDYDDVVKQIVFLTQHYTNNTEEWEDVLKNGTPSPEKIAQITRATFDKIREKKTKDMELQFEKIKLSTEKVEGGNPVPSIEHWLSLGVPDSMISDWAGKLQQSHRHVLMDGLKERVREEKDVRQTRLLYDRISLLTHGAKISKGHPLPAGQSIPKPRIQWPENPNTQDASVLVDIDEPEAANDQRVEEEEQNKKILPSSKFMEEHGKDFVSENNIPTKPTDEKKAEILSPVPMMPPTPVLIPVNARPEYRANRFTRPSASTSTFSPAALARGPVASSKPKDASAERREKEKAQRMAQIAREFDQRRTGAGTPTSKGTDELQGQPTRNVQEGRADNVDLLEFKPEETNPAQEVKVESIPLKGIIAAGETALKDMQTKGKQNKVAEEQSLLDQQSDRKLETSLEAGSLRSISEVNKGDVPLAAEDLARIRAQNREMAPKLAVTDPWKLYIELEPKHPDSKPVVIGLHCTDNMPLDFIRGLRQILGPEQFAEASKSDGFRDVVMATTQKFYDKMAKKWGAQFAYGLAG